MVANFRLKVISSGASERSPKIPHTEEKEEVGGFFWWWLWRRRKRRGGDRS